MVLHMGIEVDKEKTEIIEYLPPPTCVKAVRRFLEHMGLYRHFIKDFSKISKLFTLLLAKDTPFIFTNECLKAFHMIKEALNTALIIKPSDWILPFEIMCDVSDHTVGAVLG